MVENAILLERTHKLSDEMTHDCTQIQNLFTVHQKHNTLSNHINVLACYYQDNHKPYRRLVLLQVKPHNKEPPAYANGQKTAKPENHSSSLYH